MEFSDDMNADQLYDYLLANQVPRDDCQKIKGSLYTYHCSSYEITITVVLSIGGAAFMFFDEEFWKKSEIGAVGRFYIGCVKEKVSPTIVVMCFPKSFGTAIHKPSILCTDRE